jgi:hypothetical protein
MDQRRLAMVNMAGKTDHILSARHKGYPKWGNH